MLGVIAVLTFAYRAPAQSTAFTYQGSLSANGAPANGSFDLAFALYDSTNNPGNLLAGPITNCSTTVSNGLFTVVLDFGGGVFTGSNYFLDISVSPSGSNTFTELSPRCPLAAVPYAVYAANASNVSGTIPAAQLTGVVNNTQLANNSVTINPGPGLAGGGPVALGGATTLSNTGILSVAGNSDITVSTVNGQVTLGDTATSENTAGAIVQRDANGNFTAGTITLTGTLNMGNYDFNTGIGLGAFGDNTSGGNNTSLGALAIGTGTTGENNTALGAFSLVQSVSGDDNTATGAFALVGDTTGDENTANGSEALAQNTTGTNNIADGFMAGYNITTGSSNIDIGNQGQTNDNNIIRIGTSQDQAYIAGVINGNGAGLTNLNATQLAGTVPLAQLPPGVITNNTANVVLDGTFTENGAPVVTNNSFSNILGGDFFGTFYGGGGTTNILNNITIIGTNTPIWSADGNIFGPAWLNIYTGSNSAGIGGIAVYGDARPGTGGERYSTIIGNQGQISLTGAIQITGDGRGEAGVPDFSSAMLDIGDDVDHGIVQEHSGAGQWVYQVFTSPSGGNPTNAFYTNGMETFQILADGQVDLIQPVWGLQSQDTIRLLLSEAQPNLGGGTDRTNTFGIDVFNGQFKIGPVTGSGDNPNGTNWTGTNAVMFNPLTMDTNGNVTVTSITASNYSGNGSGLTNLAVPYVTGYCSTLTISSATASYLPLASGSPGTNSAQVETPMTAGIHGGLYFGVYDLGAGTNVTFTIMANGVPTPVSCTIAGTGAPVMLWGSDATDFFPVDTNGMPCCIRVLSDNPTTSKSLRVSWMLKY